MKPMTLLFKHLFIALILVVSVVLFDIIIRAELPSGIDSFFLGIGYYLLFYFVPLTILTILLDLLVIQRMQSRVARYFFGLVLGGILVAYHLLFILNGAVVFSKHNIIIIEAIFLGLLAVFLTEKLFKEKSRQTAKPTNS